MSFKVIPPVSKTIRLLDVDGVNRALRYVDFGEATKNVPMLLLGGTSQTINSFSQHYKALSKQNRILSPELRCQGKTELLSKCGTMGQQCQDVIQLMDLLEIEKANFVGFSFGGRVALSLAANHPERVNKLSLTGVPLSRPSLGRLTLESWKLGIERGEMYSCAWSLILNGYSEDFIKKHEARIGSFVDMVVEGNDPQKLHDLLAYSHVSEDDPLFSIPACAARVVCPTQVIAGSQDRIAGEDSVRKLHEVIKHSQYHVISSGHLIPFEHPIWWRKHVLEFIEEK